MGIKKIYWVGGIICALIVLMDVIVYLVTKPSERNPDLFMFVLGFGFVALFLPFVIDIILETKREEKINEMFLEFTRNLAESVSTGTPISKSIVNMRKKDYGPLSPYISKLANQIEVGIPVNKALQTFTYEVNSPVITRAVMLISEAERAGGEIDYILESSSKSISEVEKLKKERRSAISTLVVQGYIIFFIFIGVMLIMQFKILPMVNNIGSYGGVTTDLTDFEDNLSKGVPSKTLSVQEISNSFLYLLITQGIFSGLIIGKLTEGTLKKGVKHSFAMTMTAFLVSTGVRALIVVPSGTV